MLLSKLLPALALLLAGTAADAAPRDDLHAAYSRFLAATSFRARVIDVNKGQQLSTLQFVAPDRYHIQNGQGQMEQILIGEDSYTLMDGERIKLPMPIKVGRIVGQYRNQATLDELARDLEVTALGQEDIDGSPANVYSYTVTTPAKATVKAWVDAASGMLLQLDSSGRFLGLRTTTRIRYYDFNDATIQVKAPE